MDTLNDSLGYCAKLNATSGKYQNRRYNRKHCKIEGDSEDHWKL